MRPATTRSPSRPRGCPPAFAGSGGVRSPAGPPRRRRAAPPRARPAGGIDEPAAVALRELAVAPELAAAPEVLDHVPVDRALVESAGVGVARAEGEGDR